MNSGIAGENVHVTSGCQVDIEGIDDHQIIDIPITTSGDFIWTHHGEIMSIFYRYAYTGDI